MSAFSRGDHFLLKPPNWAALAHLRNQFAKLFHRRLLTICPLVELANYRAVTPTLTCL